MLRVEFPQHVLKVLDELVGRAFQLEVQGAIRPEAGLLVAANKLCKFFGGNARLGMKADVNLIGLPLNGLSQQGFGLRLEQRVIQQVKERGGWLSEAVSQFGFQLTAGIRIAQRVNEDVYQEKMQPALRSYLGELRKESYIFLAPGYVDTGATASDNTIFARKGQ